MSNIARSASPSSSTIGLYDTEAGLRDRRRLEPAIGRGQIELGILRARDRPFFFGAHFGNAVLLAHFDLHLRPLLDVIVTPFST